MGSIIILTAIFLVIFIEIYTQKSGVVPMPTVASVRAQMIELLPQKIEGDIWDIGSGWGGLLIALAKKYPDNAVLGYELSPLPYFVCRFRIWLGRYNNTLLYRSDFSQENFNNVGAILCYLTHQHIKNLEVKFIQEMPKTSILISSTFPLPNKKPDQNIISKGFWDVEIFKYQF